MSAPLTARRVPAPGTHPAVAKYDYGSAYELSVPFNPPPALWWSKAVFETVPPAFDWFVKFGWRFVLGLKLGPQDNPRLVAGWPVIADNGAELVMGASSWLIDTQNIVTVSHGRIMWVTVVRYRKPIARLVWALATPIHHFSITRLLTRAARSLT